MHLEINRNVFILIICVVVIGLGWLLWNYSESPYNRPGGAEAEFRKVEDWAKKNNVDLRKDPLVAPIYYKYHPEEKPGASAGK